MDEIPLPPSSFSSMTKSWVDRALLAGMGAFAPEFWVDTTGVREDADHSIDALLAFQRERGWDVDPQAFYPDPPAIESLRFAADSAWGQSYEHLSFESGYEPVTGDPTGDRWRSYDANRTAHAWVLRHQDQRPRRWVICIHAYLMGSPGLDLNAFRAHEIHEKYGVNVLSYVMPLHGPRRGKESAFEPFLHGLGNLVHTSAQAIWDLRRIVRWLREEGACGIGVHGLSLGGYTTALLGCFVEDLEFVMPGIPAVDFANLIRINAGAGSERQADFWARAQTALAVVSPLSLPPIVPKERRFIYAGLVDRFEPPTSVHRLWLHWDKPQIEWFPGSHLSFYFEPSVRKFVSDVVSTGSAESTNTIHAERIVDDD